MSPIQQMLLGVGAKKSSVFVDDVFSTYVYKGTAGSNSVNNGINLSDEGGLLWFKERSGGAAHQIFDTVRGATKQLRSDGSQAEETRSYGLTFNTNGYSLNTSDGNINSSSNTYTSWSFRKTKGFFDVVTYTGNSVSGDTNTQSIAHNLGSVPGVIIIKGTSYTSAWKVYHRSKGNRWNATLNLNEAGDDNRDTWNNTTPTATHFYLGADGGWGVNADGEDYVAYLFAGGESTAATARSVDFDGSGDVLMAPASSDYSFGSGDFTVEGWFKLETTSSVDGIIGVWDNSNSQRSWMLRHDSVNNLEFYVSTDGSSNTMIETSGLIAKTWYHFAAVRTGNTLKLFLNGVEKASTSFSGTLYDGSLDPVYIGSQMGSNNADGAFSNIRITKGQALYTSAFRVPTSPLTTTSQGATASNVKLLCCNNSSVTGATVSSGTLTTSGDPTASTDSPFDDPAGFKFGENGDQEIIKCGSFTSDSNENAEVNLGWEPQFILWKSTNNAWNWYIHDTMRGWNYGWDMAGLYPNLSNAESDQGGTDSAVLPTATGFKSFGSWLGANNDFVYIAIRRSDGYVGKIPELGTSVFTMDTGNGSTTIPAFDSNFPVDFAFIRQPAATQNWFASPRIMGDYYLLADTSAAEGSTSPSFDKDSNVGWAQNSVYNTDYQSWMWKRHAGFDAAPYNGRNSAFDLPHSLNAVPEMIWFKSRSNATSWYVYHKGLNGGTNPEQYSITLDSDAAESHQGSPGQILSLTSTHVGLNYWSGLVSQDSRTYIALLFASVDGISKVGSYTGPNPEAVVTIDCGFQPRFVIIKCATNARDWAVFDTVRGIAAGADKKLALNSSSAEVTTEDMIDLTSSGFSLPVSYLDTNWAGQKFIYYAHA